MVSRPQHKKTVDFDNWICLNGKFASPLVILQQLSIKTYRKENKFVHFPYKKKCFSYSQQFNLARCVYIYSSGDIYFLVTRRPVSVN